MAKIEAHGSSVQNIVEGCGVFQNRVKALLAEKGISDIDPGKWYDLEVVLAVTEELAKSVGPNVLVEIGKYAPKNAQFPPEINSFEKALLSLDIAYKMNHRNGNIGEYKVQQEDLKTFKVICDTPYPSKFNLGLLRGLARKFNSLVRIEEEGSARGGAFTVRV
ncbi:hypothetical protein OS242_17380 [Tumebacillus sp. DT12]|uniref:Uncharacterized protein n=1 Tax=Tumebacillus lacus TaxID=2995335 RepID=A0ABT3X6V9_9BACL|nr:hypothetical protein [Tumebacillus lacus]MCX7571718.1 hypothetical protein [Tumebacillus lacus]